MKKFNPEDFGFKRNGIVYKLVDDLVTYRFVNILGKWDFHISKPFYYNIDTELYQIETYEDGYEFLQLKAPDIIEKINNKRKQKIKFLLKEENYLLNKWRKLKQMFRKKN